MIHMKQLLRTKLAIITTLALTATSFAQDAGEVREQITCNTAAGIIKFLGKFETIAAKNRDTVMMVPEAKLTINDGGGCLLYTSPSPRDQRGSRMPSSA